MVLSEFLSTGKMNTEKCAWRSGALGWSEERLFTGMVRLWFLWKVNWETKQYSWMTPPPPPLLTTLSIQDKFVQFFLNSRTMISCIIILLYDWSVFKDSIIRLNVCVYFFFLSQEEKTFQQQFVSQFISQEEESKRRERQREEPPFTQVTQPGQKVAPSWTLFILLILLNPSNCCIISSHLKFPSRILKSDCLSFSHAWRKGVRETVPTSF